MSKKIYVNGVYGEVSCKKFDLANHCFIDGTFLIVIGNNNTICGDHIIVVGCSNCVSGSNIIVIGSLNTVIGDEEVYVNGNSNVVFDTNSGTENRLLWYEIYYKVTGEVVRPIWEEKPSFDTIKKRKTERKEKSSSDTTKKRKTSNK